VKWSGLAAVKRGGLAAWCSGVGWRHPGRDGLAAGWRRAGGLAPGTPGLGARLVNGPSGSVDVLTVEVSITILVPKMAECPHDFKNVLNKSHLK
jgi:hypothetical protein